MDLPIWIERDPGGRPCYVKKKPPENSFKDIFSEIFLPLRRRDHLHPISQLPLGPLYQQRQDALQPPIAQNHAQIEHPSRNPVDPNAVQKVASNLTASEPQPPQPTVSSKAEVGQQIVPSHGISKPQSQPPPGVFPTQLPFNATQPNFLPHNNATTYGQLPFTPHLQPQPFIPHQPMTAPFMYPAFPHAPSHPATLGGNIMAWPPPGGQKIPPTITRHKCERCGRSRSAKYHYQRQIQPTPLTTSNVCGRCKKKEKRHNDKLDNSSESSEENEGHRKRSFSHRRNKSESRQPKSREHKAESKKGKDLNDYDDSESSDPAPPKQKGGRGSSRYRKDQPIPVGTIRYVETPAPKPNYVRGRTVYVESVTDEDDHTYTGYHQPASERVELGTATPKPQPIYRDRSMPPQHPSAATQGQDRFAHHPGYPSYQSYTSHPEPYPRAQFQFINPQLEHTNHVRGQGRVIGTVYSQEDSDAQRKKHRSRSIERHRTYDGGPEDEVVEVHEIISHSPSPSLSPKPHTIYLPYRPRPPIKDDRNRDRFRSHTMDTFSVTVVGSPSEATNTHQNAKPLEDYDWYDRNGMRVRVREI